MATQFNFTLKKIKVAGSTVCIVSQRKLKLQPIRTGIVPKQAYCLALSQKEKRQIIYKKEIVSEEKFCFETIGYEKRNILVFS